MDTLQIENYQLYPKQSPSTHAYFRPIVWSSDTFNCIIFASFLFPFFCENIPFNFPLSAGTHETMSKLTLVYLSIYLFQSFPFSIRQQDACTIESIMYKPNKYIHSLRKTKRKNPSALCFVIFSVIPMRISSRTITRFHCCWLATWYLAVPLFTSSCPTLRLFRKVKKEEEGKQELYRYWKCSVLKNTSENYAYKFRKKINCS